MITVKQTPFEQALSYLGALKPRFAGLPRRITDRVQEIRLRVNRPIILETPNERISLGENIASQEIAERVREFCGYSIHSCEKQFREGWLTLSGGHRAGLCGTAVLKDGKIETIINVSSINLRIARQFLGSADELFSQMESVSAHNLTGLILIGRPMSAKTTVLRDLCRLLAEKRKVALIDERGEIAAVRDGAPTLDVGLNTDVLDNFPKAQGFITALRNLSPEYIICDEIGLEISELTACVNSGAKLILTMHCLNLEEARISEKIRALTNAGNISHIAMLGYGKNIGRLEHYGLNKFNELVESHHRGVGGVNGHGGGNVFFLPPENERRAP